MRGGDEEMGRPGVREMAPLVVIDVETSGLDPARHGIIEIGAVLLDGETLEVINDLDAEVRLAFWLEWDAEAEAVHGTTRTQAEDPARLDEAETLACLFEWLDAYRGGKRLVMAGMNPGFDLGFLRAVAERTSPELATGLRERISHRTLDLHTLAWRAAREHDPEVDLGSLNTDAIYALLGLDPEAKPHRALEGALREAEALALLLA